MEKDPDAECGSSSSCTNNAKSKLDTLSKDDLIKFAKKQMGLMQKLKSKCADLEQKVEALKDAPGSDSSSDSVIQELTERMDAVLLEKAETQQMLVLLRKENEKLKHQNKESLETLTALQEKLDHAEKDNAEKITLMEEQIKYAETKYKEELENFQKLAKENEAVQFVGFQTDFNSQIEAIRQEYESKISDLEVNLELAKKEWLTEQESLKETHQKALQKTQEDINNFQEIISNLNKQHEDEIRYLEEQLETNASEFDIERERLLLVQEELSEQIALKETYLQDVQEEEEDLNRRTQKPSELLREFHSSASEDPENETDQLRLALHELQLQNTMLKEELTFLSNVKTQLEGDLSHLKEEFSMEREELEFKINELQTGKEEEEEGEICPKKDVVETISIEEHAKVLREIKELHKAEMEELEVRLVTGNECENKEIVQEAQDLQKKCAKLSEENNAIVSEYEHTKEILRNIEIELGDRTADFVKKYNAMKDQATVSIQTLEEKLREKDTIIEKLRSSEQTQEESLLESNNELAKLQRDHQSAANERDALRTKLETNEGKLFEIRKQIGYILSQTYSMKIDEEEDISALLKHLLSKVETERSTSSALNEEKTNLQKDLQVVSEEWNDLKKIIEASEKKHSDMRKHVFEILEQHYSVKTFSQEDVSILLNQLISCIQEDKKVNILLTEEKIKQQRDLVTTVQERDDLIGRLEKRESELSKALGDIREMLVQNYSVNVDTEEDIYVLLKLFLSKVQEEKVILTQQLEEQDVQLAQQKKHAEYSDYGYVQKTSEVLPDSENLQGNQNEQPEITCSLMGREQQAAVESDAQDTNDIKKLQQELSEKESIVAHLKEEISHLQETKLSTLNENMKQMELLEKENKEKEERLNKFKAVAVKARKELENSKKEASRLKEELEASIAEKDKMSDSMKAIIHGAEAYKNLMIDYDKQTELLDKEKEKVEASEKLVGDLNRRLHVAVEQNKQLSSEREELMAHIETLQSSVRQLEAQTFEMHKVKSSVEKDLEAERLLKEQKTKEHMCAVKEVEALHIVVQKQKQQLQQTEQELEQLRKNVQHSTLLDMEMADYERLVKELNLKLSDMDGQLKEQEKQTQAQQEREEKLNQEIESLKSLVDIGEEKTAKVKQLLVKTKKDLADAKKNEASQMILQSSLKGELEAIQQQLENYKIQCSELTADQYRLQEQLKSLNDQHQKSITSYQHQVTTLQNDLSSMTAEFESTKSEFESYKIRVHNVLKQQKNKSSTQGDSDFSKQDRANMETMLEQLRSKLQESQLNVKSCNAELQQLQAEYDTLLERHNKMLQQTVTKEAELRERLLALHSENVSLKSEHSQSVAQLTAQTETLRSSFREQLHHLQDEHRSTVETLQHQINRLEAQLFQLQKEPAISAAQQQSKKPHSDKKLTDLPLFEINMAREEGEGMETTEMESASTAGTPPPSLEQLLTSPDPKHEPFVWQVEPTKEELTNQLNTTTRSMEHMNSLLHESEATNAILIEQINLLKSEMRRLERNQEREKSVANLEYLKNVLLQFIFLHAGSEKQALLPVIHTMLQLSPDEKSKLSAIAHGEEDAATSRGSGWTSYLHSWSGIR